MTNEGAHKTLKWLASGGADLSSETLAYWLAFGIKKSRGYSHPLDPEDFDRCLQLLEAVPELRPLLPRMAELSPVWDALVARWDEIEACHLDEVGLGWTKAYHAPRTHNLMKSIISIKDTQATA